MMKGLKILAIVLIVAGVAGIAYGQFTYTKATHEVSVGPIDFSVKEKRTVNIPLWAGLGGVIAGALLMLVPRRA